MSPFSAVLSVTPYYNKPNQEGLYRHFSAIAENSSLPVILYNVPSRSGVNLKPKTVLRLAKDFDKIVAIKEATGDFQQAQLLLKICQEISWFCLVMMKCLFLCYWLVQKE